MRFQDRLTLSDVRRLADLTTVAAAALLPLAADGRGLDSHGGFISDPEATMNRAVGALIEAGGLAARLKREAEASCACPVSPNARSG